jgi:hypothetical protein
MIMRLPSREGEGADFFDPPSMELIAVVELLYGNGGSLPSIEVKLVAVRLEIKSTGPRAGAFERCLVSKT